MACSPTLNGYNNDLGCVSPPSPCLGSVAPAAVLLGSSPPSVWPSHPPTPPHSPPDTAVHQPDNTPALLPLCVSASGSPSHCPRRCNCLTVAGLISVVVYGVTAGYVWWKSLWLLDSKLFWKRCICILSINYLHVFSISYINYSITFASIFSTLHLIYTSIHWQLIYLLFTHKSP